MDKFRPLENLTTIRFMSGSWYARIPSDMAPHLKLDTTKPVVQGRIRTEKNKRNQNYVSIWQDGV